MKSQKCREWDNRDDIEHRLESLLMKEGDKDYRKTMDEVFDMRTLSLLSKLISNRILDTVDFPISTGKEGNVFRAKSPEGENLAVKIYRTSSANFKAINKYILGDPRFHGTSNNKYKLLSTWCLKEYKNLIRLKNAGVKVPEPIKALGNILVMQYIGEDDYPAPLIKNVHPDVLGAPDHIFETVIENMRRAYVDARFVHADMSEYNILFWEGDVWIIDVAQGVVIEHPLADEWLVRDVGNVCRFFKSLGVDARPEDSLKFVKGEGEK